MTSFVDGPAKGQILHLKRAPIFLRVVHYPRRPAELLPSNLDLVMGIPGGKWDALDLIMDRPRFDEDIFAYRLTSGPDDVHILCGRSKWATWCQNFYAKENSVKTNRWLADAGQHRQG